jgi:uncharacterized membrane protein YjfL (UPF0719 family)
MSDLKKLFIGGRLSDSAWKAVSRTNTIMWIIVAIAILIVAYRAWKPCKKDKDRMKCAYGKGYGTPVAIIAVIAILFGMFLTAGIANERWI